MIRKVLIKMIVILTVLVFTTSSWGFSSESVSLTPEEKEKARGECIAKHVLGGAVTGGLAGALKGGLTGKKAGRDIVAGAIVGGFLGFLYAWNKCLQYFMDVKTVSEADYKTAAQKHNFDPSQGDKLIIDEFKIEPDIVMVGLHREITPKARITILPSKEIKEIPVKLFHDIQIYDYEKKEWSKEQNPFVVDEVWEPGIRVFKGPINLPNITGQGEAKMRYTLTVEALEQKRTSQAEFLIKKATSSISRYEIVLLKTTIE